MRRSAILAFASPPSRAPRPPAPRAGARRSPSPPITASSGCRPRPTRAEAWSWSGSTTPGARSRRATGATAAGVVHPRPRVRPERQRRGHPDALDHGRHHRQPGRRGRRQGGRRGGLDPGLRRPPLHDLASPRAPAALRPTAGARTHESLPRRLAQCGDERRGDAVVMWARSDRVELAARRSGGSFGTPQESRPAGRSRRRRGRRRRCGPRDVDGARGRLCEPAGAGPSLRQAAPAEPRRPGRRRRHGRDGAGGTEAVAWLAEDRPSPRSASAAGRRPGAAAGELRPFGGLGAPPAVVTRAGETLVAWPQGVRNPVGDRTEVALASRRPAARSASSCAVGPGVSASAPAIATSAAARCRRVVGGRTDRPGVDAVDLDGGAARRDERLRARPAAPARDGAYRPSALLGADTDPAPLGVSNGPLLGARLSG